MMTITAIAAVRDYTLYTQPSSVQHPYYDYENISYNYYQNQTHTDSDSKLVRTLSRTIIIIP